MERTRVGECPEFKDGDDGDILGEGLRGGRAATMDMLGNNMFDIFAMIFFYRGCNPYDTANVRDGSSPALCPTSTLVAFIWDGKNRTGLNKG